METILEALTSILTFFTSAYVSIVGFFATLIQDGNYIALAAIFAALALAGATVGTVTKKLKCSR